ncbi:oxidoreductase [Pilimelia anulata]|uniref:Oxidoreductase n=1 Tax=Pilimelia anulata TaxID=53371 RepID=A0A8J3B839_9ACTN|nr:NADP-dependent oxidoreductase [Pilimelia anulata]GGJ95034.1 oxidoreductase [Pilimelia anulata]
MERVEFARVGPPSVLRLVDAPTPVPGPGAVLVRVRAAGVQPYDVKVRRGDLAVPLPYCPGNDLAGTVAAVGPDAAGWAVGDEVLGFVDSGGYASHALVPADRLAARPAGLDPVAAGALSASGQTADLALDALGVGPGETVLVHAAAGGVGTMAVQLAVARGAAVIGTAGPANHDHLRALGATPVAYGEGLAERVRAAAPGGVDAALDAAGRGALAPSLELVADRDRVLTIADFAGAAELGVRTLRGARTGARLARLAALAAAGELRVAIRATFPLAEAAAAHALVEAGHGRGKVVLLPPA